MFSFERKSFESSQVILVEGLHTVPSLLNIESCKFHKIGPDLRIIADDGREIILVGYFAREIGPELISSSGQHFSFEFVNKLIVGQGVAVPPCWRPPKASDASRLTSNYRN